MMPNAASPESTNTHAVEAVVARAVRSSCDAIKLSLHQYQNTTELICAGQYALKNIPQDVATLVSRFVCLSGELGTSCLDLLAACASIPATIRSTQPGTAGGTSVAVVQLASRKLAEVTLSPLTASSPVVVPTVVGLVAADPTLPAITSVRFNATPGRSQLGLQIRIDDNQPAGIYTGSVIDSDTQQQIGTLTVRVLQ